MAKVALRLVQALDGIEPCRRAVPQSIDLREDIPHPVRALLAASHLLQSALVDAFLRAEEAVEIVGIINTSIARVCHTVLLSSETLPAQRPHSPCPFPMANF